MNLFLREKNYKNEIQGIVVLSFALLTFLSLISYHREDCSFFNLSLNLSHPHNYIGWLGAYWSHLQYYLLGLGTWGIPALVGFWGWTKLRNIPFSYRSKIWGWILLECAIIVGVSLLNQGGLLGHLEKGNWFRDDIIPSNWLEKKFQGGGLVGRVGAILFLRYFGKTGSYLLVITAFLVGFTITTGFSPVNVGGVLSHWWSFLKKEKKPPRLINSGKVTENKSLVSSSVGKVEVTQEAENPVSLFGEKKYILPPLSLLEDTPPEEAVSPEENLEESARLLEKTLSDFGVETEVVKVEPGPVITRYELRPRPGVKIHNIVSLADDIALAMRATQVHILAPIPGKAAVGIEIPNQKISTVYLKEILQTKEFQNSSSGIPLPLGKNVAGEPIISDLTRMPHLLIAGTTGSGKSIFMKSLITGLLFHFPPQKINFLLIDPKMVELSVFNNLPHLIAPVVTDCRKVTGYFQKIVNEMEERYRLLARLGVRDIESYHSLISTSSKIKGEMPEMDSLSPTTEKNLSSEDIPKEPISPLPGTASFPYILVVIDELADLMIIAAREIEETLIRLAQMSRAVGIHLIVATQRPSVDVITGLIKANFPARISFQVSSKVDSRTILDTSGAERLLGKGDMLLLDARTPKPVRIQAPFISDEGIMRVVNFIGQQREPRYYFPEEEISAVHQKVEVRDELFLRAVELVLERGQATANYLQTRLGIGQPRAARLIYLMEQEGIIGPARGTKPREILVNRDYLEKSKSQAKNQL